MEESWTFEQESQLWEKFSQQVQKESGLFHSWLMLLVLVNAGLVAAFVSLLGDPLSAAQASNWTLFHVAIAILICGVGLLSSGYFHFALSAASERFEELRDAYLALEAEGRFVSYRFPRPFGDENEEPFNAPEKPGPSYWLGVQLYNLVGKPEVIPRAFILGWFAIVVVAVVNTSAAWGAQLSEAIALSF
jgi:hypothetical protein